MAVKYAKHQTPYGIVTETYENADKINMVHILRFQLNDNIDKLTSEQITEIAEIVADNIESRHPEDQVPCNLAVQIMRLSMKLIERFA